MTGKNETVNINVLIAERIYPIKVVRADEEKLHKAVKLVNEKISQYQDNFAGKDKQDYMAMCLLNFAVEQLTKEEQQQQDTGSIEEKISRLEAVLSGTSQ